MAWRTRVARALTLAFSAVTPSVRTAAAQIGDCTFVLGFADLHALVSDVVGIPRGRTLDRRCRACTQAPEISSEHSPLLNTGSASCTFHGYPGVTLQDAAGLALPTHGDWGGGYFSGQPAPQPVTVAPGGQAEFEVHWEQVPVRNETSCSPGIGTERDCTPRILACAGGGPDPAMWGWGSWTSALNELLSIR